MFFLPFHTRTDQDGKKKRSRSSSWQREEGKKEKKAVMIVSSHLARSTLFSGSPSRWSRHPSHLMRRSQWGRHTTTGTNKKEKKDGNYNKMSQEGITRKSQKTLHEAICFNDINSRRNQPTQLSNHLFFRDSPQILPHSWSPFKACISLLLNIWSSWLG